MIMFKSYPLCGGGDLLFLLSPPAAAFCFCSHSKTPARIISNWPWGTCQVIFFVCVFIPDGCQNPMLLSRAWTVPWICFMFGLKKDLTLAVCWLVFGVILMIKTLIFLRFSILAFFQLLQQNPRWPSKPYVALWSLNRFMDLFHVWFNWNTLPCTCAD